MISKRWEINHTLPLQSQSSPVTSEIIRLSCFEELKDKKKIILLTVSYSDTPTMQRRLTLHVTATCKTLVIIDRPVFISTRMIDLVLSLSLLSSSGWNNFFPRIPGVWGSSPVWWWSMTVWMNRGLSNRSLELVCSKEAWRLRLVWMLLEARLYFSFQIP